MKEIIEYIVRCSPITSNEMMTELKFEDDKLLVRRHFSGNIEDWRESKLTYEHFIEILVENGTKEGHMLYRPRDLILKENPELLREFYKEKSLVLSKYNSNGITDILESLTFEEYCKLDIDAKLSTDNGVATYSGLSLTNRKTSEITKFTPEDTDIKEKFQNFRESLMV